MSLAERVKNRSKSLSNEPPCVYKVPLKKEFVNVHGCSHYSFGETSTKQNRTILVLGATGAGKTTLINGMINYILGVQWDDSFRFKLIDEDPSKTQAYSQTSMVSAYKINHQEGFQTEFSLTIVDTPGFGDTGGIDRDKSIVDQLHRLFSDKLGISEIDAVCFVAQASLARLTHTQRYVFDSVLSIFGKDIAENIRMLVTFADSRRPPVLEAVKAAQVPCPLTDKGVPVHFKFNNSALFADKSGHSEDDGDAEDDEGNFDKMFWNMGVSSMKRFFSALATMKTKSLTLTKEVLREREQLENTIENVQKKVKVGLAKLEEIEEMTKIVQKHQAEITANKNFEFEVKKIMPVQTDISHTKHYITNCQQCHTTCHYPCGIPNDADKRGCVAMGRDGHCRECKGKCPWNVHFNQKYKWDYKEVKEKCKVNELFEKYQRASKAKMTYDELVENLKDEYERTQFDVVMLMEKSAKCLDRLKEIALKPNPLSTPEYIDLLIQGEKSEAKTGWMQRVQSLEAMREKALTMVKAAKGENPLK